MDEMKDVIFLRIKCRQYTLYYMNRWQTYMLSKMLYGYFERNNIRDKEFNKWLKIYESG